MPQSTMHCYRLFDVCLFTHCLLSKVNNFLVNVSVEQLTAAAVNSYAEIESKEQEGTRNRTVAATNMNATSSRAHTIVAINFTQKAPNAAGESMTKQASINLVDLAGR